MIRNVYDKYGNINDIQFNRTNADHGGTASVVSGRAKEQDVVKVNDLPTLPNLTQWRIQVAKNLFTASGHPDLRGINWWGEIGLRS